MKTNEIKCLKEYEANPYTMAILPLSVGRSLHSRVLEVEEEFLVELKPIEIVDRSCRYFGSSFKGRKEGTKDLMGITHKPPIIVDPSNEIFLFPTASPLKEECVWLSHSHIVRHFTTDTATTIVKFRNQKKVHIDISKGSFENQLFHTAQLRTIISSRMEGRDRQMNLLLQPRKRDEVIRQDTDGYKFETNFD